MSVSSKQLNKMVAERNTQVSILMPIELKIRIDEAVLRRKKEGKRIKQKELLIEYIEDGLKKDL